MFDQVLKKSQAMVKPRIYLKEIPSQIHQSIILQFKRKFPRDNIIMTVFASLKTFFSTSRKCFKYFALSLTLKVSLGMNNKKLIRLANMKQARLKIRRTWKSGKSRKIFSDINKSEFSQKQKKLGIIFPRFQRFQSVRFAIFYFSKKNFFFQYSKLGHIVLYIHVMYYFQKLLSVFFQQEYIMFKILACQK